MGSQSNREYPSFPLKFGSQAFNNLNDFSPSHRDHGRIRQIFPTAGQQKARARPCTLTVL